MRPELTPEAEIAHYPADAQALIRQGEQEEVDRYDFFIRCGPSRARNEAGYVVHRDVAGHIVGDSPASRWFRLSYASWLTLPRMGLQEMPLDWQARFFGLLHEAETKYGLTCPNGIEVSRRINGRFVTNDHWNNYRRGNSAQAEQKDIEHGYAPS